MADRGHTVRLVTLGPVLDPCFADERLQVRTRPIPRYPWEAVGAARSFLRDIHEFRPDLLHLHYAGGKLGTMATVAGVHPLVVTVMGGDVLVEQHLGGHSRLERRATRRVLEEADLLLVKSDRLRAALSALGDFADKIETVRWGVDPARFRRDPAARRSMRERLAIGDPERVVLSPRILQRLYNIHLIVEAMPHLLSRVPEALLLVTENMVDPEYRRALAQRVEALRLGGRVRFVGRFAPADMPALYNASDVVVSVPASDGLPQSLFEAMAAEVPVVLGRLTAYDEVVRDGESALLVDFTPEGITRGLGRALTEPALAQALVLAARKRVMEVACLPREVERVESLYRSLTGRRGVKRRPPLRVWFDAATIALR
jgi:glycosyltransferase involved in cell wall biosynthesis